MADTLFFNAHSPPADVCVVGQGYYKPFFINGSSLLKLPLTCTVLTGSLPPGLSITVVGIPGSDPFFDPPSAIVFITGIPTTTGNYPYVLRITDHVGHTGTSSSQRVISYPDQAYWTQSPSSAYPCFTQLGSGVYVGLQMGIPPVVVGSPYSFQLTQGYGQTVFLGSGTSIPLFGVGENITFGFGTYPCASAGLAPPYTFSMCGIGIWDLGSTNYIQWIGNIFNIFSCNSNPIKAGPLLGNFGLSMDGSGLISGTPTLPATNNITTRYVLVISVTDSIDRNILSGLALGLAPDVPTPTSGSGDCCCCCQPISLTSVKYNPFMCHM